MLPFFSSYTARVEHVFFSLSRSLLYTRRRRNFEELRKPAAKLNSPVYLTGASILTRERRHACIKCINIYTLAQRDAHT